MKRGIDEIAGETPQLISLAKISLMIVFLSLSIAVARFTWRKQIMGSATRVASFLQRDLFFFLMQLGEKFFNRNKSGDLLARTTYDVEQVVLSLGWGVVLLVDSTILLFSILFILIWQYGVWILYLLIPLPCVVLIILLFAPLLAKLYAKIQSVFGELSHSTQEILSGAYLIKAYRAESSLLNLFKTISQKYVAINLRVNLIQGIIWPAVSFLSNLTILLLLYSGGKKLIEGTLSPGDFIAILSYLTMITWPIIGGAFVFTNLQRGAASLDRINKVLEEIPELEVLGDRSISPTDFRSIKIKNGSFRYEDSLPLALKEIDLRIEEGKTLGILGRLGSGKSTLISLLNRIYDLEDGEIELNDLPLTEYSIHDLRSLFGIVSQSTFLFSNTIRNNIRFGRQTATDEEIDRVVSLAAIEKDLSQFPQGLETIVGEKGVTLSGGQKQRLSIARALLVEPTILILDDALSACDSETSQEILQNLKMARKGKSNLIISHRIDVIQEADHIIVLEDGKITQEGDHEKLREEEGFYREMERVQSL